MRCRLRSRGSILIASFVCLAVVSAAGCSSGESAEAGAVGTTATDPLGVTFSSTYLTIENRTGVPLIDARVEILPRGVRPPFRTTVPRVEASSKTNVPYNQFRSADGTPFRRGTVPTKTLKVTAKDVTGKGIAQETPFD